MIEAVVFDYGGVVHSLSKVRSTQIIADAFGLTPDEIKPHTKDLLTKMGEGKITEEQYWHYLSKKLDKPIPDNYQEIWPRKTTEDFVIYPEIINLIEEIKAKGILAVVLSNTIPPHAEFNRKQGGYDHFDKVFLSHEIGIRKPDRRAYEFVIKGLNLKADECLYVDDMEENLVPARELGMKTILAKDPDQVIHDVRKTIGR